MPNHVHLLAEFFAGSLLGEGVKSWKSFSAHEANRILGRSGQFWQEDYFDRFIRDTIHFESARRYIRENPVTAGLVNHMGARTSPSAVGGGQRQPGRVAKGRQE